MLPSPTPRLTPAALALLAEAVHLGRKALHGGIASHRLRQRADLPGLPGLPRAVHRMMRWAWRVSRQA